MSFHRAHVHQLSSPPVLACVEEYGPALRRPHCRQKVVPSASMLCCRWRHQPAAVATSRRCSTTACRHSWLLSWRGLRRSSHRTFARCGASRRCRSRPRRCSPSRGRSRSWSRRCRSRRCRSRLRDLRLCQDPGARTRAGQAHAVGDGVRRRRRLRCDNRRGRLHQHERDMLQSACAHVCWRAHVRFRPSVRHSEVAAHRPTRSRSCMVASWRVEAAARSGSRRA